MEYILEIKFEDKLYNAIVHFITTFVVDTEQNAQLFVSEIESSLKRKNAFVLSGNYLRIDDNEELRNRRYEYYDFCINRATAKIEIEQFLLKDPDQNKSLIDNLTEKFFNGEESTARIGKKFDIPARVIDKDTRNPIEGDIYYFNLEHLIPKKQST